LSALHQKVKHDAYPECTSGESNQGTAEARFFTLGSDSLVDALPKPNVRVDVPGVKKDLGIRRELNFKYVDIRCTLPEGLARRSKSGETKSSEDACSLKSKSVVASQHRKYSYLRQGPDSIIFATLDEPIELEGSDPGRFTESDAPSALGLVIPVEEGLFREPRH